MQLSAALAFFLHFDTPRDKDTVSVLLQIKIDPQFIEGKNAEPINDC